MGRKRNKKDTSTCHKCGQEKRCRNKIQDKIVCSSCSYVHRQKRFLQPFSFLHALGIGSSFGEGDLQVKFEWHRVLLTPRLHIPCSIRCCHETLCDMHMYALHNPCRLHSERIRRPHCRH